MQLFFSSFFCKYKAEILHATKPLYSNPKLIAYWRNACILHGIVSEFCPATVSIEIHPSSDRLICTVNVWI